ncbi:MAG: hypothetical protein PHV37_09045 [Candidatus Gastranaerophilales bacterium]|nr:hypothetical protein [Candidatus Gastranaerophilales bacterium]
MSEELIPEKKQEDKEFGKFGRWDIESAVRTIIEAEQIKLDTEKMKYVLPMLDKQKAAVDRASSVAEILYGTPKTKEKTNEN